MSDTAYLLCRDCRIILPLGVFWNSDNPRTIYSGSLPAYSDQIATGAMWKFAAEHVYHQVGLIADQSQDWDIVDIDFTQIGSEENGAPSVEEYLDGWTGYALAVSPRPVSRRMRGFLVESGKRMVEIRWSPSPVEAEGLLVTGERIPWPISPDVRVSVEDVENRLKNIRSVLDGVKRWVIDSFPGELATVFIGALEILRSVDGMNADQFTVMDGGLAPVELYDIEWSLAFVKDYLNGYTSRAHDSLGKIDPHPG
jgi:hypothetical protein